MILVTLIIVSSISLIAAEILETIIPGVTLDTSKPFNEELQRVIDIIHESDEGYINFLVENGTKAMNSCVGLDSLFGGLSSTSGLGKMCEGIASFIYESCTIEELSNDARLSDLCTIGRVYLTSKYTDPDSIAESLAWETIKLAYVR